MHLFVEILGGVIGLRQPAAIPQRQHRYLRERFALRAAPDKVGLVGTVVELPVAEGDNYHLEFQPFRLVNGHHPHGILLLRRGDREFVFVVVPPGQERGQVGRVSATIVQHIILESLYVDALAPVVLPAGEAGNDALAHLEQRLLAHTLDKLQEIVVEMLPDVFSVFKVGEHGRFIVGIGRFQPVILIDGHHPVQLDRRVLNVAEYPYQQPDERRVLDEQRLARDDVEAVARVVVLVVQTQQQVDQKRSLASRAGEEGNIAGRIPPVLQVAQQVGNARQGLVAKVVAGIGLPQGHFDPAAPFPVRGTHLLPDVGIGLAHLHLETVVDQCRLGNLALQLLLQPFGRLAEDAVVELHHPSATAVIRIHRPLAVLRRSETRLHPLVQQRPVGIAPPVDTLLHIAHNQIGVVVTEALADKRSKVAPLQIGGILKLVDHKVVDPRTNLLVDKGGIVFVDHLVENPGRIGEQQHIVLSLILLDATVYVDQYAQGIDVFGTLHGGIVAGIGLPETGHDLAHDRVKLGIEGVEARGAVALPEPVVAVVDIAGEGRGGRVVSTVGQLPEIECPRAALPLEAVYRHPVPLDNRPGRLAQLPHERLKVALHPAHLPQVAVEHRLILDLGEYRRTVQFVVLLRQLPGQFAQIVLAFATTPQAPPVARLDALLSIVYQPAEQPLLVIVREVGIHAVDGRSRHEIVVHLDLEATL